jgi:antitoxin (DNA-binding transcriptional repressor) of toxin-antitoxin stability system
MSIVSIHQPKTHFSRLIAKAFEGEEVIIARGSQLHTPQKTPRCNGFV